MRANNTKLKLFIGAMTFFLLIGIGYCASAQMLYNGIYWVNGQVLAPTDSPGLSVNGRQVVLYQTDPAGGYALDVTGADGNSGRSGEFMLNAMEDWRLELVPGTYKLAILKGSDGYGLNPIDVTITGNGFENVGNLRLVYGEGITGVGVRALPPWLVDEIPVVKSVWFDGKLYQKALAARGLSHVVSTQPKVSVKVTAGSVGIDKTTLSVVLDESSASKKTYGLTQFTDYSEVLGTTQPREISFSVNLKGIGDTLGDGDRSFTIYAGNSIAMTSETVTVTVLGGPVRVIGTPVNYPSPLRLGSQNQVTLQYGLNRDANIDLYIFDISGQIVKKIACNKGTTGGMAGGEANPNKVVWDLMTDQGNSLGTGIYVWEIVDRDNSAVIGKGKLAATP